jgi:Protein of unknown function (DUF2865)
MRSRLLVHVAVAAVAAVAVMTGGAADAAAQSLFEALFGPSRPKIDAPGPYQGNVNRLLPPGGVNSGTPYSVRPLPPSRRNEEDDDDRSPSSADRRGSYHTVCVRLCDGFYWPVSYAAPRSRLYRDANACSASCGTEARLFHYPTNGGQMQDAVDLTGRAYSRLPTAFKYRKALVPGCACKAEPWSQAEQDRHRIYALNEEAANGKAGDGVAAVRSPGLPAPLPSGNQETVVVGDATDAFDGVAPVEKAVAAVVDRRPARSRSQEQIATAPRPRSLPNAVRPPAAVQSVPAAGSSGGFWGGGQSAKYNWPGDPPPRVR